MKTPTEVQADMIMELEARLKLSDDDVFYLRHNNITLTYEVERLKDENAALRADKDRLDWLSTESGCIWAHHESEQCNITRRAIDAAMKEVKP
jgi:hypothetical protein